MGGKKIAEKSRKARSIKGRKPATQGKKTRQRGGSEQPAKSRRANKPKARKTTSTALSIADLQKRVDVLTRELKETREQRSATTEVLRIINSQPGSLAPVFDAILQKAHALCGADDGSLQIYDGEHVRAVAVHGVTERFAKLLREGLSAFNSPASRASFEGQRYIQINDARETSHTILRAAAELTGTRTILYMPLRIEGRLLGFIAAARREVKPFRESEIDLLENFAAQAVIAIENARLFNETKEALERQTATGEILASISNSITDPTPVFEAVLDNLLRLFGTRFATIFLLRDGMLHSAGLRGDPGFERIAEYYPAPLDDRLLPGRAILTGRALQIAPILDNPSAPSSTQKLARQFGYNALISVPLIREGKAIGALSTAHRDPIAFTDKQVQLASSFADQAVIAIENARLFNEVQARTRDLSEALIYQTGSANILNVIASSPTDVGPALKAIVESACEICGAHDAVVFLKERDDLVFSAHHGPIPIDVDRWPINRKWITGRALVDKAPQHIHDLDGPEGESFPEARVLARHQGQRTVLSVPLLQEGEAIGVISLRRVEVQPFNDKQIELLKSFADQAVIAISNVRLFEEVQQRTRDLSESLQQQTATADVLKVIGRSAFDINQVFETVVESSVRLCAADRAIILRFDGELLRVATLFNAPERLRKWLEQNPIRPGRYSVAARTALEKRTVQVEDVRADPDHTYGAKEVEPFRTVLGVPMLKGDNLLGVILVYHNVVKPFTEKQVLLVSTFAEQAAIAIENVRLFDEVQARTRELAKSLDDLRAAQDRLIQTEKLASLGQLTAGIAHEIKNPLNFVNNFSALSVELTDELNEVLNQAELAGKIHQEVGELTKMLKSNLEKVVQHGKRADSIVKNMLLHSREGSGERRSADINSLVGESLNLAYHGARAEKAGFSITLKHDLDPEAGALDLYPQEMTRALLNLISNGFYAATKRKVEAGEGTFEPVLSAATRNLGKTVEIRIRDNGSGIPADVKEKMFNPFFTTKPTGEGTGLGLSMTHDIIVKQHGGRIDVETEPGEFTEFIITLPRGSIASGAKPE